jgi:stage V sporulation protein G
VRLYQDRALKSDDGRAKLYADIAHPINSDCREMIQEQVLIAYMSEVERSKLPGYVCIYDDYGEDSFAQLSDEEISLAEAPRIHRDGNTFHRRDDRQSPPATPHVNSTETAVNALSMSNGRCRDDDDKFGAGII